MSLLKKVAFEKSYPEAKKNGTSASPATARARRVLPVPGGLFDLGVSLVPVP